jgi:hypothetical protein
MASRSHTTFKKRQKEQARLEKQRDKAVKRVQRKLESRPLGEEGDIVFEVEENPEENLDENSLPEGAENHVLEGDVQQ